MNEWKEERVVATVPYCWCCEHLIRTKEFQNDCSSEHHGCWKLCANFEPGFDLMSGIYPKCPLPKVMAYHYMSEDGKCLLFKVKPVDEVEGGQSMTKGMKGDQFTIFRRALRWLRICKDVGIRAVDYVMFLNHVDPDYEFSEEDLMAVYERLHDDGYLANVGRGQ